jgi:hypothetical protein
MLLALTGFMTASAQNLTKIKTFITDKKFLEANTAIDELLKVPKYQKNHEVYYLKSKVLSGIASDPALRKDFPNVRMKTMDAFKKAMEIEKNETMMLLTIDKYEPIVTLYTGGFEEAADHYNNSRYEESYSTFKESSAAGEYIFSQGWGLYKLDTTLTLYLGLSALNSKKEEEAVGYFSKLADENIGGTPDRATPYRFLAKYYYDKKDEAKVKQYIESGLKLYPQDDFLPQLMIESVRDKNDMGLLLNTYKDLLRINPIGLDILIDFASEIFSITHLREEPKASIGQTKENIIKTLGQPNKISKTLTQNIDTELLFYENEKMEIGIDVKTGKVNYVHELKSPWLEQLGSYQDKCSLIDSLYKRALGLYSLSNTKPFIGQSKQSVIENFGSPDKVSKTTTQNSETELLIYEEENMEIGVDMSTGKVDYIHQLDSHSSIKTNSNYSKDVEILIRFSLGKHYYNQMLFVEEDLYKIKGQGPDQTNKRAEISAAIDALGSKAIPHLESVFNYYDKQGKLKVNDRSNFKSACTLLTYCYNMKKDKAKADFYQNKYDEADAAHQ